MLTRTERTLFKSLTLKKGREEHGIFLVEGSRSVREVLASRFEPRIVLHTRQFGGEPDGRALLDAVARRQIRVEVVSPGELSAVTDTVHASGVAAIVEMRRNEPGSLWDTRSGKVLVIALDAVSDPGNVGAMIRTADWFGADGVVLGHGCVDVYNPKVVRSTMGSLFHLPVLTDVDLRDTVQEARNAGVRVVATGMSGSPHSGGDWEKLLVVFGSEAHGVSPAILSIVDATMTIPRLGNAESLNVSVACGIILSDLRRGSAHR
jgi:TrmH family RNA methyltransferase